MVAVRRRCAGAGRASGCPSRRTETAPMTRAQPNSATSGRLKCGRPGMAREKVPSPVQASRPMKTRLPTPAASRPGTRTTPSIGPPRPDASMSRNAPTMGDPSRVLMAAKLPADASTDRPCSGTSRLASRKNTRTRPPPSRMSGISGPRTAPKISVARAARTTPGSWAGVGAPCILKPPAGEGPPSPGRYLIAAAAIRPPSASTGSGHHTGVAWKPRPCGRWVKISFCR